MTFVPPVSVDLSRQGVGLAPLEETVIVTGESPIVDVQSARRQTVIGNDVLRAIPTVRSYNALVAVVPGVVTNTNDVVTGTDTTQFPIHGGRNNEGPYDDRRAERRQSPGGKTTTSRGQPET